jgi:hypothetical protein
LELADKVVGGFCAVPLLEELTKVGWWMDCWG